MGLNLSLLTLSMKALGLVVASGPVPAGSTAIVTSPSLTLPTSSAQRPYAVDFNNLPYQETVRGMAQRWMAQKGLPGVWCALIKGGKVVACVATGSKNDHAAATVNDHLNVGSVSKVITGEMLAQFVAKGVISYDTTVGKVFPDVQKDYPNSPFYNATLLQLITHTAGIPRRVNIPREGNPLIYRLWVLKTIVGTNVAAEPGRKESYSNLGMQIAVAMVERLTGQHYEDWLQGDLGKWLGLTNATMLDTSRPSSDDVAPHFMDMNTATASPGASAAPYAYLKSEPNAGCSVTLPDLCSFVITTTLSNGGQLPSKIYTDSLRSAFPGGKFSSVGWECQPDGWVYHNGSTGRGEFAFVSSNPRRGSGFVFYTNGGYKPETNPGLNSGMDDIIKELVKMCPK